MARIKTVVTTLIVTAIVAAGGVLAYAFSGAYNIGADVPHTPLVHWLAETVREHSVDNHSAGIQVPDLKNPDLIREGAGHYAAMCSGCHLAPGYDHDETREGLYPKPPKLYEGEVMPAPKTFWVIKHGIKMSGMPAWGNSHDDQELWALTAFVMQLPDMNAEQYKQMMTNAPMDDDMTRMPMPHGDTHEH